jgi:hypothetical protein
MHKKLSPVAQKKYGASSFPNQIKEMQVSDLPWSRTWHPVSKPKLVTMST